MYTSGSTTNLQRMSSEISKTETIDKTEILVKQGILEDI